MPLNASGPISIGGSTVGQSINLELGRTATTSSNLNETALRTLASKASGAIALSDFYGKSNETFWIRSFLTTQTTEFYRHFVASNGDIYALGQQNIAGSNLPNSYIVKLNSSGTVLWQRSAGGIISDWASDAAIDSSNNLYVLVNGIGIGPTLYKFDANGTQLLSRRVNIASSDWKQSVFTNPDRTRVYVTGSSTGVYGNNMDLQLAQFDTNINTTFYNFIGNTDINDHRRAVTDSSGAIYMCGSTGKNGHVTKLTSTGGVTWVRSIVATDTQANVIAQNVSVDANGNVYVVGTFGYSTNNSFISMYNSSGTLQWRRIFNTGSLPLSFWTVAATSSGCFVGGSYRESTSSTKAYFSYYNSSGTVQWTRLFHKAVTNNFAVAYHLSTPNSAVLVATMVTTPFPGEATVFRFPSDGSKTGTYGSYVYATATFNDQGTGLNTDGSPTFSSSSQTLTVTNVTAPAYTTTIGSSITSI